MRHIEVTDATTNAQNEGRPCIHCGSRFGHYSVCPLINREVAEARSATLSKGDEIVLYALGVRW